MGSQFWDLDFTQGASHDPGLGIFLAHDFQDMDGEPCDFTLSEGHAHPLVAINISNNERGGPLERMFSLEERSPIMMACFKIKIIWARYNATTTPCV